MEAPKFSGTPLAFTRSDRHGACYLEEYSDIWKVKRITFLNAATVDGLLSGGRFSYRNSIELFPVAQAQVMASHHDTLVLHCRVQHFLHK